MVFWYNVVSSRKQIGKSVGRLVLSVFGLKTLSRYLLDCNCYFLFVFLLIFLVYCSFFRVSAAILPFTIILLLYLGFQFMFLLQFCMGNI